MSDPEIPAVQATPPSPHPPGVLGFLMDAFEDIRAVMRSDPAATSPSR